VRYPYSRTAHASPLISIRATHIQQRDRVSHTDINVKFRKKWEKRDRAWSLRPDSIKVSALVCGGRGGGRGRVRTCVELETRECQWYMGTSL